MNQSDVLERVDITIDTGDSWNVILHNDNKTPMEFVVYVLNFVFKKQMSEAVEIMLHIHNVGNAVAGTYSCYDIAEQKLIEIEELNNKAGCSLKATIEQ